MDPPTKEASMKPITNNTLFYGDNLKILRDYIPDESIDLVYLDPPFNSQRTYNVLFSEENGRESEAQISAFEDTWHWDKKAEEAYHDIIHSAPANVSAMISALRDFIGNNQMMAYLVMMTIRLIELHRVLKSTGSIYLHCDPTASHYLKIVLDAIFGAQNFRNEIVWQRTSSHPDSKKWGAVHDTIFYYSKSTNVIWNKVFTEYNPEYIKTFFRYEDERGPYRLHEIIRTKSMGPRPNLSYEYKGYKPEWGWRVVRDKLEGLVKEDRLLWGNSGRPYLKRYLNEQEGSPIIDIITDIPPLSAQSTEKLGYPTQKPLALLERILQASSNENDWVLDPFAGCGTSIAAAQKHNRRWIGIDITHLSIALLKYRLKDSFEITPPSDYEVIGEPTTIASARQLAQDDRYQFQWWALSLVRAKPLGQQGNTKAGKRGSDKGIDGIINFIDDNTGKPKRILVQVKSGKVKSGDIRDLRGTIERENASIGVFITLEPPTKDMTTEAVSSGFYKSELWNKNHPRIQILTIEELLDNKAIDMPPIQATFKEAKKEVEGHAEVRKRVDPKSLKKRTQEQLF